MTTAPRPACRYIAAVEGGGTSFKIAICEPTTCVIVHRCSIDSSGSDSSSPDRTLRECATFLQLYAPYQALGIAVFGPVGVKPSNVHSYGKILPSSPKAAWRNVDILSPLLQAASSSCTDADADTDGSSSYCCPVLLETDVNAPAISEYDDERNNNSNSNISSCAYITVGTGVGVELVVNGLPVHGRMHPEGGHVPVSVLAGDDTFGGYSWGQAPGARIPFHGIHTVEGIASSVALTERYYYQQQKRPQQQKQPQFGQTNDSDNITTATARNVLKVVPDDNEIWDHAANALANLCVKLLLTLSMEKIVFGGGIMQRSHLLLPKIRHRTAVLLNGYLGDDLDFKSIITVSKHGDDAGLIGAIRLAQRAMIMKEKEDTTTTSKQEKQQAFRYGLWHGILVGALSTALIVKYGGRRGGGGGSRR